MNGFIATFQPLAYNRFGSDAFKRAHLPPYVDGSCRREPDLQSPLPTISALCRGKAFLPRLKLGDEITYVTKKSLYEKDFPHWRYVARLKLVEEFWSHEHAAFSYIMKGLNVPRNCVVSNFGPERYEDTHGGASVIRKLAVEHRVRIWDAEYSKRTRKVPMMFGCVALFKCLVDPPIILPEHWHDVFGKVLSTENPGEQPVHLLHAFESAVLEGRVRCEHLECKDVVPTQPT